MTIKTADQRDPRDVPNYSLGEAARWLGLVPNTLRVWLQGQAYPVHGGTRHAKPVVHAAATDPTSLSFWNLVECSVLLTMRKQHRVSLQKVRKALDYVGRHLGKKRPLIEQDFSTDGVGLFVDHYGKLIDASKQGQTAIREVLQAGLTRIERDEGGLAARLFPWRDDPREDRIVALDARVAFGQPVLANTRIPVEVVFDRFRAGDKIDALAADYRVSGETIEDLVRKWFGSAAA